MNINIDSAIFIGFLVINLAVGLRYGRGVKTIEDYALGGRNFSTGALVATIVASLATGTGFFVALSKTYSDGLPYTIASTSESISIIITALFIIPKMAEFLGSLSVAEVMGNLYGKQVRCITALCGIVWMVGSIAVEFKIFGNLFNYFLGIPQEFAIVMAASVVILYSAFGGIRAVTYTDILQFFTFGFIIPLIAVLIWNDAQSANLTLNTILEDPKFDIYAIFSLDNPGLTDLIFLILYFSVPIIGPLEFHRISMGRNIKQVKTAFLAAAILYACINILLGWIPMLISTLSPGLDPSQIVSHLINNYTYTGLKGLLIVGISAMAMSSADSFINTSSVLFGHDLKEVFDIKVDNLILSKIFALLLGTLAVYLALSTNDLLSMIMTAASFYMPVVTVPLILSIIGFRSSTKSVLIAMTAGFCTVLMWDFLKIESEVIIPAMLVNMLFLFGSHYLLKQPGGWITIQNRNYLQPAKKEKGEKFIKFIELFKVSNFIKFCKKTAPQNDLMYMGLGIYCIFYTFSTMYSTQVELLKENGRIVLVIYQIMMVTGVVTAMYPIWPPKIKKKIIAQVGWNIIIFYMLVLFSSFFVMVSHFGQLQFVTFTVNIIITAMLVGWKLSLVMMLSGFYFSMQFYKYYAGIDYLDFTIGSPQFIFMYSLILIGSALIIFLKPKQEYIEATEEKNEHLNGRLSVQDKELEDALALKTEFLRNIPHEYHAAMTGVISTAETLRDGYDKLSDKHRKMAIDNIFTSSISLKSFDDNITTLARLSKPNYELNKENINFSALAYERVQACRKYYEENTEDHEFVLELEDDIIINADKSYMIHLLDNLVMNAIKYCKKGKISIALSKGREHVNFVISDEGIGIPKAELYDIFKPFAVSSKTRTLAGGRGVGLATCWRIVEIHGGSIKAESNGEKGSTFRVELPL